MLTKNVQFQNLKQPFNAKMLGFIIGDCASSHFEIENLRNEYIKLFDKNSFYTNETVQVYATINTLQQFIEKESFEEREFIKTFKSSYLTFFNSSSSSSSGLFSKYVTSGSFLGYNSNGNLAMSRIIALSFFAKKHQLSKEQSDLFINLLTKMTHDSRDALAVSNALFEIMQVCIEENIKNKGYALKKEFVTKLIETAASKFCISFKYDNLVDIRILKHIDKSAITALNVLYLVTKESKSFEHAIKLAISLGGDCTAYASLCGVVSQFIFQIEEELTKKTCECFRTGLEAKMFEKILGN